jgi:DHA1 family multidrug resistance protein-like MFS transporter
MRRELSNNEPQEPGGSRHGHFTKAFQLQSGQCSLLPGNCERMPMSSEVAVPARIEQAEPFTTEAQRKRGLFAILFYVLAANLGFFATIPLVVVQFVDNLGWSAGTVGFALAARLITQQTLSLFGGAAADRFGPKPLLVLGVLVRGLGFAMIGWAAGQLGLIAAMVIAGLGGAIGDAPRAAAVAHLTDEKQRRQFFGLMAIVGAVGTAIGPLLGVALLSLNFQFVTMLTGLSFASTGLVMMLLLPRFPRADSTDAKLLAGVGLALKHRSFRLYTIFSMGYWFAATQLTLTVPLVATGIGDASVVSWIFLINATMIMSRQYPALWIAERHLTPLASFAVGVALMGGGLGALAFVNTVPALLVCVGIYSLGSLLANPNAQTVTAEFATPVTYGSYFGFAGLAGAFGGGFGQAAGGSLYSFGHGIGLPWLSWVFFGLLTVVSAIGLFVLSRRLGTNLAASQ